VVPREAKVEISVSDAKAQLTDLVRRAESGDDVVLTRHGQPAVRLVAVNKPALDPDQRWQILDAARRAAMAQATPGPDAASIQDSLYGDDGLPL